MVRDDFASHISPKKRKARDLEEAEKTIGLVPVPGFPAALSSKQLIPMEKIQNCEPAGNFWRKGNYRDRDAVEVKFMGFGFYEQL